MLGLVRVEPHPAIDHALRGRHRLLAMLRRVDAALRDGATVQGAQPNVSRIVLNQLRRMVVTELARTEQGWSRRN